MSNIERYYQELVQDRVMFNNEHLVLPYVEFDNLQCNGVFFVVLMVRENYKEMYNEDGTVHAHVVMDLDNRNQLDYVVSTNFPVRRHARLAARFGNVLFFRAIEPRWSDPVEAIFLRNDASPFGMFDYMSLNGVKANLDAYRGVALGLLHPLVAAEGLDAPVRLDYIFPVVVSVADLGDQKIAFTSVGNWPSNLTQALALQ